MFNIVYEVLFNTHFIALSCLNKYGDWFTDFAADEYKGHCLLDACRQSDTSKVKKYLSSDTVNFRHPYTGETPLVSPHFCNYFYFQACLNI